MASDRTNQGHPRCHAGQDDQSLSDVIENLIARFDARVSISEVGIIIAMEEHEFPTGTPSGQQVAMEAQGFTCQTLEAFSVQDARRLTLLLAGFPTATTYSHALRPGFIGPSAWFSCDTLGSGEVIHLLRMHWGIVVANAGHRRPYSIIANPESRTTSTEGA